MCKEIGMEVFVKFGVHHGKKAVVAGKTIKSGLPAYILIVEGGEQITKKQKNTIRMKRNG